MGEFGDLRWPQRLGFIAAGVIFGCFVGALAAMAWVDESFWWLFFAFGGILAGVALLCVSIAGHLLGAGVARDN